MTSRYEETHRRSLGDPEGFWAEAAEAIDWERRWDRVLDSSNPPFHRWFRGGRLNTCWNALDRHVAAGKGGRAALLRLEQVAPLAPVRPELLNVGDQIAQVVRLHQPSPSPGLAPILFT